MKLAPNSVVRRVNLLSAAIACIAFSGVVHAQVNISVPGVDIKVGEKGVSTKVDGAANIEVGGNAAKGAKSGAGGTPGKCVNGVLRVSSTGTGDSKYGPLACDRVEIYVKAVGNVSIASVTAKSTVISSTGTGDLSIQSLVSDSVEIAASAVGNVKISQGSGDRMKIVNNGTGDIDAANVVVNTVTANLGAAGNVTVNAKSTIDANISGTGDLVHAGAARVNAQVSGVGSARPL
jgi:Putative auto-transporter adhesin, head GIN domain